MWNPVSAVAFFAVLARSGAQMCQNIENMRRLVYAFYDPNFSFKEVNTHQPEAADQITDCLSGDVNKDFSQLWSWIREFVPLPEELPHGEPLIESVDWLVSLLSVLSSGLKLDRESENASNKPWRSRCPSASGSHWPDCLEIY